MHDGIKSRKFWLVVGCIAVASAALFTENLAGSEWATFTTFALGIYKTANVMEKK